MLDLLATRLDGKPAAANTFARRRSVLFSLLGLAVDEELLEANPLDRSRWSVPEAAHTVDPDVVINPEQARDLLAAVAKQGDIGRHLVAFYGCMYYAALRPSEAVPLTRAAIRLPDSGWGEFRLRESAPLSGSKWSDTGRSRDSRQLKQRARGEVRVVPIAPPLTELLNAHLKEHGTAPDGRLFRAPHGAACSANSTATSGERPAAPRWPPAKPRPRSPAAPTTFAMPPSAPGSTAESTPPS